ncbi:hypothetical protein C2G38_2099078 [Gigaspora rosea]|uniref:Uncharacterized protein n=1 Tax=Gigaspora rosea TaxID=44941 RepID=A0A397UZU3_9GLOM|nr:hypothetical protein C2G38_2099078 [Gigaspora rosea]
MAQNKRACNLLFNKSIAYWFPSVDEDYKGHEHPREPTCYRWTRFFSLCLVYLAIIYFIIIFILSFTDQPSIQMSRSQVNNIPVPVVFISFNSTVFSNFNINCSYILATGATISCNDKLSNITDNSVITFVYNDPSTNFTDGTSMTMPVGFDFRISANNSFANDLSPAFITYPTIRLVDPDLFVNTDRHADDKLTVVLSEESNMYVLSPYQRQIVWLDRVKYSDLGGSLKRGVLSVAVKSSKHSFNYFGLLTRMQTFNPLNPQVVPSQFTNTFEIYNQSSTLVTYKESE